MSESTRMGMNKTGLKTAPLQAPKMLENEQVAPSFPGTAKALVEARRPYLEERATVGTVPPPAKISGAVKTIAKALTGERMNVLVDKLGERAAFERAGTRLYELFLAKFDVFGSWPGGPTREELVQIRNEEHSHFLLVAEAVEQLGGDPTAVTPAADAAGVASQGIIKVLADPRMDLRQSLEALLIAELADNDAWGMLVELCRGFGQDDVAERFEAAREAEERHLRLVRTWLKAGVSELAGVSTPVQ